MSKKLGKLVKDARTEKGMTQAALAEQAGISATEVGKIERGEKEPAQDVLKRMAKALGITQKSLLDAASGAGATSGKKASSSGKAAGKASASKASGDVGTLTATEKKLVQLYRKADSSTKKAAMGLLSGDKNAMEVIGALLLGKSDVSAMASGLLETVLSGKKSADIEN